MVTSDKLKAMVRVLENGRVIVRDFSTTEFKTFSDLDKAFNYLKEQLIKGEVKEKDNEN